MFESIRKKIREYNEDNNTKNISFDFKLMFVFHIAMMIQFGTRIIDNAEDQVMFALGLGFILALVSIVHKQKNKWKWPGMSFMSLSSALLNLLPIYGLFAFAAYAMQSRNGFPDLNNPNYIALIKESWEVIIKSASIPIATPWFLAGVGIGAFNMLTSLKLVSTKKSEFEEQCKNS